ncbi:MAG: hypothetical protein J5771_01910 [Bacteroidales bacterium]|nr:hypothetical protein [Bacteroidales bacterium]
MKKIYVIIAVAAIALFAASCGNKKAKEAAQEPAACEQAEATPAEEVKDAAVEAAAEVAQEAIAAGADAAKEALK